MRRRSRHWPAAFHPSLMPTPTRSPTHILPASYPHPTHPAPTSTHILPTIPHRTERGVSRSGAWRVFLEALKEGFQKYLDDDCSTDALAAVKEAAKKLAEQLAAAGKGAGRRAAGFGALSVSLFRALGALGFAAAL